MLKEQQGLWLLKPISGKFDDLVYRYVDLDQFLLLQAKHKLEKTKQKKKITFNDLATEDESKEFSLLKYFKSYLDLKYHPKFRNKIKHPNDLMIFPANYKSKTYKLSIASNCALQETLKEACDMHILANTLALPIINS